MKQYATIWDYHYGNPKKEPKIMPKRTKHEIRCRFRDTHDLLIPAHTTVTWREGGQGGWSVEPFAVKVLSETEALFKHDSSFYFIWVREQDLEETSA